MYRIKSLNEHESPEEIAARRRERERHRIWAELIPLQEIQPRAVEPAEGNNSRGQLPTTGPGQGNNG